MLRPGLWSSEFPVEARAPCSASWVFVTPTTRGSRKVEGKEGHQDDVARDEPVRNVVGSLLRCEKCQIPNTDNPLFSNSRLFFFSACNMKQNQEGSGPRRGDKTVRPFFPDGCSVLCQSKMEEKFETLEQLPIGKEMRPSPAWEFQSCEGLLGPRPDQEAAWLRTGAPGSLKNPGMIKDRRGRQVGGARTSFLGARTCIPRWMKFPGWGPL